MVPRPVQTVAALLLLGFVPAVQGQPAQEPAGRAPTDLERILQHTYLDDSFVLRADVKMKQVTSRRVVRSTVASSPALDLLRPITVVTGDGVFYMSDYARKERLISDVHMALGSPDILPSGDPQGGFVQTADVVEISAEPRVLIRAGDLARITGVAEIPAATQVTLEGPGGGVAQVLVRSGAELHRPAVERADGFTAALGQLLFLVPDDPERWMQAGWSEKLRTAIREHRVVEEMTHEQVLLAWGTPLYLTGDEGTGTRVWTYQRGATLKEQLRNRTRVYFAGGVVMEVEADR
ncbi:MAG: hypothetical protein V3U11_03850 [Planctomycetota bacterium]